MFLSYNKIMNIVVHSLNMKVYPKLNIKRAEPIKKLYTYIIFRFIAFSFKLVIRNRVLNCQALTIKIEHFINYFNCKIICKFSLF